MKSDKTTQAPDGAPDVGRQEEVGEAPSPGGLSLESGLKLGLGALQFGLGLYKATRPRCPIKGCEKPKISRPLCLSHWRKAPKNLRKLLDSYQFLEFKEHSECLERLIVLAMKRKTGSFEEADFQEALQGLEDAYPPAVWGRVKTDTSMLIGRE